MSGLKEKNLQSILTKYKKKVGEETNLENENCQGEGKKREEERLKLWRGMKESAQKGQIKMKKGEV